MKKRTKTNVVVIFMAVIMAIITMIAVSAIVTSILLKPADDMQALMDSVGNESGETTEEETPAHTQNVVISFNEGIMTSRIQEICTCGETTSFRSSSNSKDAALNIVKTIKCGEFYITDGESETETFITREDLVERINEYEFIN